VKTKIFWIAGIVAVVFVMGYLIGGPGTYSRLARQLLGRAQSMLQPPTQQEMQVAAIRDSIDAQSMTKAVERARKEMRFGRPAPYSHVAGVIAAVFIGSLGLMFVTGRERSEGGTG
jgi:hypothetical protein